MTRSPPFALPWPLEDEHREIALALLRDYYRPRPTGHFTGAYFERLGGGGDRSNVAYEFTAEDFIAVSMLSVDVPASAALRILGPDGAHLSELLRRIPTDVDLVDVEMDQIVPDWAPWQLEVALKSITGLGPTTVSKLIARKRPRLVPVFDSVVEREPGLAGRPFWTTLNAALRENDRAPHKHLVSVHDEAEIGEDISPLRVFDVVTWMTGQGHANKLLPDPVNLPPTGADD